MKGVSASYLKENNIQLRFCVTYIGNSKIKFRLISML